MRIFFAIYSILWTLVIPLLKFKARIKTGFNQRLVKHEYKKVPNRKKILLYAASGGEAQLACTYIKYYLEKDCIYYCFSWTKEGVDIFETFAKNNIEYSLYAYFAPFDKPRYIFNALSQISPDHSYIFETEIWLGFLYACKKLNIAFSFVNARMSEKTLRSLSLLKPILSNLPPKAVYALSEVDKERFSKIFHNKNYSISFELMNNLKFIQARELLEQTEIVPNTYDSPIVLFASIRQEEENDILSAISKIRTICPSTRMIICPKHIERSEFWKNSLDNCVTAGEKKLLLQDLVEYLRTNNNAIVWNSYGALKILYQYADIVFVGGSIKPLGGQNFLEPLACGVKPYVGMHVDNFLWVYDKKPSIDTFELVNYVDDSDDLSQKIIEEIQNFSFTNRVANKTLVRAECLKWLK